MVRLFCSLVVLGLAFTGCAKEPGSGKPTASTKLTEKALTEKAPLGALPLTPKNAKIEFVGTHVGEKPDPRKGGFAEFSGAAVVDGDSLKSISVDIDTGSLFTEIDKLTNHLKTPDFFDVRQYPRASFKSPAIEPAGDGTVNITGDLTLLKVTKSITFPAKVSTKTKDSLSLESKFDIDRTDFGMNFGPDKVEKKVALAISVGK